jgi:hypothetical protein
MMATYFVMDEHGANVPLVDALRAITMRDVKQVQPAPADVAAVLTTRIASLDARAQRAELQLADARQANEQLTAQLATLERKYLAAVAGEVHSYGNHAQRVDMVQTLHEAQQERDEYRAQADAARQAATEAAQRAEAAEAKWKAIPWEGLGRWVSYYALPDSAESLWFYTNRPTAQAQD